MKHSYRCLLTLVFLLLFAALLSFGAAAEGETLDLTLTPRTPALVDGKETASVTVNKVSLSSQEEICGLYLLFYDTPTSFTLSDGEKEIEVQPSFLRQFVNVKEVLGQGNKTLTVTFLAPTRLLEIYAFGEEIPSWVQIWQEPWDKADLCLMTTHADDEQLFFAGVLPYYAGEKDYQVQVIYFTDHKNEPLRRHELLKGLWTVGVDHYPVISSFPYLYSTTLQQARTQLEGRGFSYDAILSFQVEMLRRFKPLVVIGHDPEGEYGHGQHRLNSATLQEALTLAADKERYPESAEQYGTWDVPKTYLHLYPEGQITVNWDIPLEKFGGKTAFQMTQEGFLCHASQQYTWFRRWLFGNNSEIQKAEQITTHSPCQYGLFRSTVGEDVEKNDFFENVKTWEEQRLEEEERLRLEEEERLRLEEEKKKEEERLRGEKLARAEAEKKQKEKEERETKIVIGVSSGLAVLIVILAIFRRR